MRNLTLWMVVAIGIATAVVVGRHTRRPRVEPQPIASATTETDAGRIRALLFAELQPIRLANCELRRYGEPNDGGYLLCANLLKDVRSAYSYGISGYDGWGCQVSRELQVMVHEYDCFDARRPVCDGGARHFQTECVAGTPSTDAQGHVFDTVEHQIAKNRDSNRHLLMKMDVEGAEWESLPAVPDAVLQSIDQLAIEFHGSGRPHFLDVVRRLKRFFYVANLHFNNYSCSTDLSPFPSWAYEVLFVNKNLGHPAAAAQPSPLSPANAPNNPIAPDCQSQ